MGGCLGEVIRRDVVGCLWDCGTVGLWDVVMWEVIPREDVLAAGACSCSCSWCKSRTPPTFCASCA